MRSIGTAGSMSPLMPRRLWRRGVDRRRRRRPGNAARRSRRSGSCSRRRYAVFGCWLGGQGSVPGEDASLAAAIEDGMHGDNAPFLENAHLIGLAVHFDGTPLSGVRDAVEIAADRDHAVAADAPRAAARLEWPSRKWLELGRSSANARPQLAWSWHGRARWRLGRASDGIAR